MQTAGMRKRWRFQPSTTGRYRTDSAIVLAKSLQIHPLVAHLLINRGLSNTNDAQQHINPKLTNLYDPSGITGVRRAAERILQAVKDNQPIVIYGDYDVDGITGSAILWHVLKTAGVRSKIYIPHRLDEGYGLNSEAIRELAKQSADQPPLIISVDCGITAVQEAHVAKEAGVSLIITDHHTFDANQLPDAEVLVHPGLAGDRGQTYPCPYLCGAAVAFKLAWQFARLYCGSERLPQHYRDLFMDLLSLVALGTIADIVPLKDENRILTVYGLGRVKHTCFTGLNALIDAAKLRDEKIDAYHVGFVLGPRLNASGRMGHAKRAVHLLTEANPEEAREIAAFLTLENERRRKIELEIFKQANKMVIDNGYDSPDMRAIVLGSEGWHQGVIGIVASRLLEAFGRPVIMLNYDNGIAQGSARSVVGVSIYDALSACSQYLDHFGGHDMAAGLSLCTTKVGAFRQSLIEHINQKLSVEQLTALIDIDAVIELEECNTQLFEQIQRLAPFGKDNRSPRLMIRRVTLDRPAQRIGATGRHLSLMLRQDKRLMRAVAFGMGDLAEQLPAGVVLDIVFKPKLSMWQGVKHCDLHVEDLQYAQ